jgi:nucleoside-diphosphate-sugar epimerase/glycosyltransferase involved in cell wall biosynthesis
MNNQISNEILTHIKDLQGPILIIGASGFIGAHLCHFLAPYRSDVYAVVNDLTPWRLKETPGLYGSLDELKIIKTDIRVSREVEKLFESIQPKTIFDCAAFGAYSFQKDFELMYRVNVIAKVHLLDQAIKHNVHRYIHAGSSSEYGANSLAPQEAQALTPNSHYAVSKAAVAGLINYYGREKKFPCCNLRLYSVYGPLEDSSRLIPAIILNGIQGTYPPFVSKDISRDFIFTRDVCEAFIKAARHLTANDYGESFNIGTGIKTTLGDVAQVMQKLFHISGSPNFSMQKREWDVVDWVSNPKKAEDHFQWKSSTTFEEGLIETAAWVRSVSDIEKYKQSSKQFSIDTTHSVTAIIACYKDGQAIPIMYERLVATFKAMQIDYEIIFVNDCSPDNSEQVIRELSKKDGHVIGISHTRNFGSQAAFRSGLEIATKNGCVLLDGDLQDPPELIKKFVERWREGYEVIYGRRVKRDAPLYMQFFYKLFYRLFDYFSYITIPHDAGDFGLLDKRVVKSLLQFPERDLFMRGIRAFAGFKQCGVDYIRPERAFGTTTNNFFKNINWAKKGIFSFSNTPLNILSSTGVTLFCMSIFMITVQILAKILFPESAPKGIVTVLLSIIFFGSINLLGIAILGEYVGKILEEAKQRPHFIRRWIIRDGTFIETEK